MSADGLGQYRLRTTMRPLQGQPVNWNARAIIWSGNDRRWYLRWCVYKACALLQEHGAVARGWRYRLRLWLFRCVDDRSRTYTPAVQRVRRLLNTEADVEARRAWIDTNKYWRRRERARSRGSSGD